MPDGAPAAGAAGAAFVRRAARPAPSPDDDAPMRHLLLADPLYYETVERYQMATTFADLIDEAIPDGWSTSRKGVWLRVRPPVPRHPRQGFKIHVSAVPTDAVAVLRAVARECVATGTAFKCAADPRLLRHLNSKRASRTSSGKFITIYPVSEAAFMDLLARVHAATASFAGPYILSDRRYPGSECVFYRYGGFESVEAVQPDGSKQLMIEGADGELVPDQRLPYFVLPAGVEDPVRAAFPEAAAEDEAADDDTTADGRVVIAGRYEIDDALAFSNTGGVYVGLDRQTQRVVVLKEARPRTSVWSLQEGFLDAVGLLEREYAVLCDLAASGVVVKPVDLVREWEHTFLVQDFVEGDALRSFRANENVILTVRMHDRDHLRRFCGIFRSLALSLIDAVTRVHALGYVIGDLSPNNVMVDPERLEVTLIDMESAHRAADAVAPLAETWYTAGFRPLDEEGRRPVTRADDLYAAGMSLYSLVIPVQHFFEFHPPAVDRFIDRFVAAGLPPVIRDVIGALTRGDAAEAVARLEAWTEVDDAPIPGPSEIEIETKVHPLVHALA